MTGEPRVQYKRVVNVAPAGATLDDWLDICRKAYETRATVGFSYDDAGIGDLQNKTAVLYGIDSIDRQKFIEWYETHYPGTVVKFAPAPYPIPEKREDMPLIIDISKWQDRNKDGLPHDLDFFKLRDVAGVRGVIIRKSDRIKNDTMYYNWLHAVQQADLPHGNYHRLSMHRSGADQCDVFLDSLYEGALGDWLDVEAFGDDIPSRQHVLDFEATYAKATGKQIGIYTNFSTWKFYINDMKLRRLWIANYEASPGALVRPLVPAPWSNDDWGKSNAWVKMWQYGMYQIPGSPAPIDCNAWHGSVAEFNEMVGDTGRGGDNTDTRTNV